MRYAFEYFIRSEFKDNPYDLTPADTQMGFFFEIRQIILIMFGYLIVLVLLALFVYKLTLKSLQN